MEASMRFTNLLTFSAALVVSMLLASPAKAQKLTKAEFWSRTGDDNKDHDTGVYVYAKINDLSSELAKIENADNSDNDRTEYNDHSEHTIKLIVESPGATKESCKKFKFRIGSKANGNDKWKIEKAKVTLYFDDGTNLVQECGAQELNSRGSRYLETDWQGGQ
jgi:hypothetical protein